MSAFETSAIVVAEGNDVEIYRGAYDAAADLEAADVLRAVYEAYDLHGRRIELRTDGYRVLLSPSADTADYSDVVSVLVRRHAAAIGGSRLRVRNIELFDVERLAARIMNLS